MKPTAAKRRRQRLPRLMGAREVAAALGVRPTNLQFVKDLPEPAQLIDSGARSRPLRLWLASDIEAFAKKRAREHDRVAA